MSAWGDPVSNVGEGGWTEKYMERNHLIVEAEVLSVVIGLWGVVDGGVYDGPPKAPAWHRYVN